MSMATEILAFLVAQGLGTDGANDGTVDGAIFRERLPETPDICSAVISLPGAPPELGFGVAGYQFETPGVRIQFRGVANDSDGPEAKCQAAYKALATVQGASLSGTPYLMVRGTRAPAILPGHLGRDEKERVIWTTEALCEKELSA